MSIGRTDIEELDEKDVIFVMGKTGAGKTTFICKLKGLDLIVKQV